MASKNLLFYIRTHLFNKKNVLFTLIFSFIIFLSFLCLTLCNFVLTYKSDMINKNLSTRTLLVYSENSDYSKINDINHVIFNDSSKYLKGHYSKIIELSDNNKESFIQFLPSLENNYNLKNGETICPKEFYPYYLNQETDENIITASIDQKYMLDGDQLINKELTIISDNDKNADLKVKLVATYDASKYINALNTCYITKEDYDKVISPYKMIGTGTDVNGNELIDYYDYDENMVIVDNYNNVNEVIETLKNMDFEVTKTFEFNSVLIKCYFYIPIFICIIILIICLNLIYNFLNKKAKYRLKNYGILKASGYDNKTIKKIELWENIILLLVSFTIAFSIYIILFNFILNHYLLEEIYNNISINIPFRFLGIEIILLIFIIIILTIYVMNKVLKNNPAALLKMRNEV